jgi:hypothetical protein
MDHQSNFSKSWVLVSFKVEGGEEMDFKHILEEANRMLAACLRIMTSSIPVLMPLALSLFAIGPVALAQSYSPTGAYDYQYLYSWNGSADVSMPIDMTPSSSCNSNTYVYQVGAWDASNGYAGVVFDVGNPTAFPDMYVNGTTTYFFPNQSVGDVSAWLPTMENCYNQGFLSVTGDIYPSIYLSFNNDTSDYQAAGQDAGTWVNASGSAVLGAWVDFEGQWSTETNAMAEVSSYLNTESGGSWLDAGWRSDDWTYSQMMNYIDGIITDFYSGSTIDFLYPQNYADNMNTCGDYEINQSSCPENPWVGSYVSGITAEYPQSEYGYTMQSQWTNYQSQPYPNLGDSTITIVSAYQDQATSSIWQSL